jgi:hypothetical protein
MVLRVAFLRTDNSEECSASIIKMTRIYELRITLTVTLYLLSVLLLLVTANVFSRTAIPLTLIIEEIRSAETSVLTRVTLLNFPVYGILHSPRRENSKSYIN